MKTAKNVLAPRRVGVCVIRGAGIVGLASPSNTLGISVKLKIDTLHLRRTRKGLPLPPMLPIVTEWLVPVRNGAPIGMYLASVGYTPPLPPGPRLGDVLSHPFAIVVYVVVGVLLW